MLNLSGSPYFDDFDKDKKFYRILFRPGMAVQARELTQSQSILQEQIKKGNDHIFQHGAMVIPGQITLDKEISYQKMVSSYGIVPDDILVDPVNFLGYTVIGASSGVEGDIKNVAPATSTDPLTFFIKFKDSGTNFTSIGFWDGETVYRKDDPSIRCTVQGTLNLITPTYTKNGKASITSIGKGVYYINGIFVDNDAQSIVVSKYTQTPTCKVGLRIVETIVTPEEDISLTDNAQGSPNYAANGAHRYKIDLKLEYIDATGDISDDFVILQYLRNGEVVKEIRTTDYAELEKTFARRTFDESGDYTVNPFAIILKEHLRDETVAKYKEGVYFSPIGDDTKIVAELGKGKAYVQGYEISKISNSNVEIDKARDFAIANNSVTNFSMGNYIKVENLHNIPRIDEFGSINLYDAVSTVGTFTGDMVGTAKVRAIKYFGLSAYLYLFDVVMGKGKNFETDVKWIYDSNGNGTNNFTCQPLVETGKVYLYKVRDNKLLFSLPNNVIKTLSVGGSGVDTSYSSTRAYFNNGIVLNTATLTAKDNEVFQQNTADFFVSYVSTGEKVTSPVFTFSGSPTGKVVEISGLDSPVNIIAPITKMVIAEKTKLLQTNGSITINVPNKKQNARDYLGKADVIKVKNVYMSVDLDTVPTINDVDIRERYQMDTGARDNYYDVGSIILKGGQNAPTGRIMVTFDYFTHSAGDYFSVDSYDDITFDEIPVYTSSECGESFSLADCLDFRPRMADDRSGFTGSGASIGELPQVFTDIRSDYEYYMNRIDYLYLNYRGDFSISRGVPAVNPKPPEKPETGMVLYEIFVNAYTFTPNSVKPSFKDNKRYTMRDIGDIDRRVGKLEYYTALSLLERETASMEILDQNGLNRFKNGFIVDPFDSHKVGDATHTDYKCSIDPINKKMRPKFNDENIGLLYDSANSVNVQKTGGIITLPYNSVNINKQNQASKYENINPFAFRNIFGKLTFNPDSDVWHDSKTLPTLIVDNSPNYEALSTIANQTGSLMGVEWGRWEDVGGRKSTIASYENKAMYESRIRSGISYDFEWERTKTAKTIQSTTTTTTTTQNQVENGVKNGFETLKPVPTTTTSMYKSLGDRITDVNYIPYMRSIPVLIKTDQMKKKTKVYPFFDNIAMSAQCEPPSILEYCTPASKIMFSNIVGTFKTDNYTEEKIRGNVSGATALIAFQTDNYLLVLDVKGTFNVGETVTGLKSGATIVFSSIEIKSLGDPIITGDYGEVALIWNIPNDANLKFMTGERDFVLTDQMTNADPVHTYAKGAFKSNGLSAKQEDTVLSTKTINFTKVPVKQQKVLSNATVLSTKTTNFTKVPAPNPAWVNGKWHDPVAQSFMINETGGCFLTKVSVWFQSKDDSEGVICEIRNMVNGYPAEILITEATLQPKFVNVSEREPGLPTDFIFPEPIYLKEGQDYCFVLKPSVDSASYNVWIAENGRIDLKTGEVITGKESLGSFFKSQNASTWTADQNEDIMFTLYKAKFDITSNGYVHLVNDEIAPHLMDANPIETYNNTDRVRIYHPNHGLTVGSIYNISGLDNGTNYNGFLGSQLNGLHTVTDVELDSFTFIISGTLASDTGLTGGTSVYGTRNYQLDVAHPIINELVIDGTSSNWSMKTTTGTSVNGTQLAYIQTPYMNIINNTDIHMTAPMLIASKYNETEHLIGTKSLVLVGELNSINENVSPVVDADQYDSTTDKGTDKYFNHSSSTLIAIANRIDFPSTTIRSVGSSSIFSVGIGEDELVISHPDHELGTGANIVIEGYTSPVSGTTFNPNGLHEIRVINKDSYLIDMKQNSSTGYSGSGGGAVNISYSTSHFKYIPESKSFNCSAASRYLSKQVSLQDPSENLKIFFGAVREQEADIDVYYKTRGPYETTEWNDIDWIRIDVPDEVIAISQNSDDVKDYSYTVEDIPPFNAVSVKLVMNSTNSTQVPIFSDLRIIATT